GQSARTRGCGGGRAHVRAGPGRRGEARPAAAGRGRRRGAVIFSAQAACKPRVPLPRGNYPSLPTKRPPRCYTLETLPAPHPFRDLGPWRCPLMAARLGRPGNGQAVSCPPPAPVVPTATPLGRGQTPRRIPRQAISIVLPPPGLSWRMLGVG